jgi:hypothetical protein
LPATYRASLECPSPRLVATAPATGVLPQTEEDTDPLGTLGTYQPSGPTNRVANAFFQPLGTNGRACVTCHDPADAMSVSVDHLRQRFRQTRGADPIFAPVDGANCPSSVLHEDANLSAPGGKSRSDSAGAFAAHSLLLTKGLLRIFLPVPSDAEYVISVVSDPYHCNTEPAFIAARDPGTGILHRVISVYRRPRPATNLKFVVGVPPAASCMGQEAKGGCNIMWDGREPNLKSQALDATLVHAQALVRPSDEQLSQIVAFETGIFSAQVFSSEARSLTDLGALGGPEFLATVTVADDAGAPMAPFTLFDSWRALPAEVDGREDRESVFRGQQIFETRSFTISNVAGVNDERAVMGAGFDGTCSSCHSQREAGTSARAAAQVDIGIGGDSVAFGGPPPSMELPVFKLQCPPTASTPFHGRTVLTNDPGKALITGKCADIGRFTVSPLRGLAARAPYFSDGSAHDLIDVVNFYDKRFAIGLSAQDKTDLVRFLSSL